MPPDAGGVDASIPLAAGRIGQQGGNTLAAPGALIDTLSKLQQMQLFPGQLQRQQQEIQQGGIGIEKAQQELKAYKNNLVANGMMPLFLKGESATLADATNRLGWLQAQGYDTTGLTAGLKNSGATGGQPLLDVIQAGITQAHPELGVPKIEYQQIGDSLVPVNTNPFAGKLGPMGAPLATTLTPAEKAGRVTAVGAGGQAGTVPLSTTVDRYGNPLPQPAIGGGSPVPSSAAPPVLGGGSQSSNQPGFMATSPPPGFTEQATESARGNAQQALALQSSATNIPQQKATLGNLQAKLTQFTSGPVADWKNFAKSFVNEVNPFGNIFDPSRIASQDEFKKQAVNLAQQQFQALHGTGTDAQLSSTTRTSPNDYMSNMSNQGIIDFLKGNADAVGVMNSEWQKWLGGHGGDASTYGKFVTDFNKTFDPRIFQAVYASPEDKQVMLKGMTANEQKDFRANYNAAVAKGWIPGG